jgi:hypothetical protein
MQTKFFLILLSLTLIVSCHKKAIVKSNEDAIAGIDNIFVDASADISSTGAMYRIDSVKIIRDVLSVFVNYSGGCKEHHFDLISNGVYTKSSPPQIALCLKHINNEDMCRKLIMKELKFNISKIKCKGSKSLLVKIGEQSVEYIY